MRNSEPKRLLVGASLITTILAWTAFAQTPIKEAKIAPSFPAEVSDGDGKPLPVAVSDLPLDFFDDFSWRSFVALNWPAKTDRRGEADAAKTIGDPGPRVWETWKTSWEILLSNGNPPGPWASLEAITPCSEDDKPRNTITTRIFGSFAGFEDLNEAGFSDQGGPLIAQNRTYTRYETRVNQLEYEFIADKQLYLKSAHKALKQPGVPPLRFPNGSVEVKAAWRELKSDEPAAITNRFYSVNAKVRNPMTGKCEDKRMGLVGLHIVHKTPLRPQWVWSSFEQVDNVPGMSTVSKFSYNDPNKAQATDPEPDKASMDTFQVDPIPTQVTRQMPLHPAVGGTVIGTAATNLRYQKLLANTVWANYALVVTQWPTRTIDAARTPPDDIIGDPFPDASGSDTSVGNTTMETYHQAFTSCMDCHDTARSKKLDFVFFLDLHAFNNTGAPMDPASLGPLNEKLERLRAIAPLARSNKLKGQ